LNDLVQRAVTGCIYVALLIAGTAIHPVVFAIIFATMLFFTQLEFYQLMESAGSSPCKYVGLTLGLLLFGTCFGMVHGFIPQNAFLIFIPALTILFLVETFRDNSKEIQNSSVTLTGFVYVAVPFSLLNFIVYPDYPENPEFFPWILMGVFFIVWVYDSMAYLVGSMFGKHKINEKISPNKTWEGFFAGAIFALAMGVLNAVIFQEPDIINWIIIAVIVVAFGTLGDLFESKIKRKLNVKDSGSVLPGHGGLLDRLDSLLFVIPVIYVWLTFSGNL
jgi:phosphatidate cytidylyltransferase